MFSFIESPWLRSGELASHHDDIERFWAHEVRHHVLTTQDGFTVTAAEVSPEGALGNLVIIPGRGETEHKYAELLYCLSSMKIRAAVLFPRGQGLSSRLLADDQKCHMESFADVTADLQFLIDSLKFDDYAMLAFSLGGLEALDFIYKTEHLPSALALIVPFLWPATHMSPQLLKSVVGVLGALPLARTRYTPYGKAYKRIPFAENHHSHDEVRYNRYHDYYAAHPELTIGSPTWGFVRQTTMKQTELFRMKRQLPVRILCMNAELDRVVSPQAAREFFNMHRTDALVPIITTIKNAFHDVLNEKDEIRNPALTQALNFLKEN